MSLPIELEASWGRETRLADEYHRTGKVEGYDVEEKNGRLTMYALDQSEELTIMIEGGHDYDAL